MILKLLISVTILLAAYTSQYPYCTKEPNYAYNSQGYLTSVTLPMSGATTSFTYDAYGRIRTTTDSEGYTVTYSYDALDRPTDILYPDGSTYSYIYQNNISRLSQIQDPNGTVTTITYNADGTTASLSYAPGTGVAATPGIQYQYDPAYMRRTQIVDGTGTTTFSYYPVPASSGLPTTGANMLETVVAPVGTGNGATPVGTATTQYHYDALGRVVSTSVDGSTVSFTYDSLGRVTNETNPVGSYTYAYVDTTPRIQTITYPSSTGIVVNYNYYPNVCPSGTGNGDERLQSIAAVQGTTPLTTIDYSYNPTGTIASVQRQDGTATANLDSYTYDNVNQLISSINNNISTGSIVNENLYQIDANGNIVAETKTSGTTVKQFNNIDEFVSLGSTSATQTVAGNTNVPITSLTINSLPATISNSTNFIANIPLVNGTNVLSIQAHSATLGAATQLVQLNTSNSSTPVPITWDKNGNILQDAKGNTYQYDGRDQLVKMTYPSSNSSSFSYNGMGQRTSITQQNSSGTTTATQLNVYRGSKLTQQRNASNAVSNQVFSLGTTQGSSKNMTVVDLMGSNLMETDANGNVTGSQTYDASGNLTASSGTDSTPNGWMGMYSDPTSGDSLTSTGAYDPSTAAAYGSGGAGSSSYITDQAVAASAGLFSPKCFGQSALQAAEMVGGVLLFEDLFGAEAAEVLAEEEGEGLFAANGDPNCFVAGTPVATACGSVPIEKIKVGDRVLSADSKVQKSDTLVNSSWQTVKLKLDGPHAVDVVWLRPAHWVAQMNIHVGGRIFYDDPEMSVSGWATVVEIGRAPPVQAGTGRVVTSTVTNYNSEVFRLKLSRGPPIEATATHPVYSTTRQRFVRVGDLKIGEHLGSRDNKVDLVVVGLEKEAQPQTVYNLEVEEDHHYFVGLQQLLVHNANGSSWVRPSWRQSEIDVGNDLPPGALPQTSFQGGSRVVYGTPGSVRPDYYYPNFYGSGQNLSVEVKNYNITTNSSGLVNNVSNQAIVRNVNLPPNTVQSVVVDVTGQSYTDLQLQQIANDIEANTSLSSTPIIPSSNVIFTDGPDYWNY